MTSPIVPARLASTVLLLRDGAGGLEVFMVRRHEGIEYLGGSLVFPGGRVDEGDREIAAAYDTLGLPLESVALRIAAIRETFEEAGVLLARPVGTDHLISTERLADFAHARHALHERTLEFADLLRAEKLVLAPDLLVPYAHWITPIGAPKRFDTHFFLVAAPHDQEPLHDGNETVDSRWVTARQALDEAVARQVRIAFPTRMNLQPLLSPATVADALNAARARRVVTVFPEYDAKGRRVGVPADAGYGPDVLNGEG